MLQSKDTGWRNGYEDETSTHAAYETHFTSKDTRGPKAKGWEKMVMNTETNTQRAGAAMRAPDKTGFKAKALASDTAGPRDPASGDLSEETQNATL